MQYINDFESNSLEGMKEAVFDEKSGFPKFPASGIRARRCMKCDKIVFANYEFLDYVCRACRTHTD